ncbi:helix-turn-helix domain containing protein [Amycolatopsis sp. FDAARGOS 1241]|uniref:helix-turn-helix domain containing protein n=1 Tax=Amycolatopsis sp. FDAARGOS 1241 TaxID=2778070 RepID=UPI00194FAA45|nr:helix-turn-helix domain containing protein [Amycolatopsis sp. FDAARGOS 1241]QRP50789.1 helix-turn-helix domain containing protein [Amycolatopsis sp. FDAARGOS 1241]
MTIIEEHRTEVRVGNVQYQIAVVANPGARAEQGRVTVTVGGEGPEGEPVAHGRLDLDTAAVPTVADLLAGSLHAFAGTGGPRRRSGERPAQQGKPWSAELDAELESAWLAGEPVAELARRFARTAGGIRARLPRVGCDPERPGHHLPAPPSLRGPAEGAGE